MSDLPLRCVVDASVGIKLFVNETMSESAQRLFTHLSSQSSIFYAPDLFFIECTNVLWKYVRRGGLPAEEAQIAVNRLCRLALRKVSTAALAPAALTVANSYGLTAYDAAYVALAQRVNAPLITADEVLIRKLAGSQIDLRWLASL